MKRHFTDHKGEESPIDGATLSLASLELTEESMKVCWPGRSKERAKGCGRCVPWEEGPRGSKLGARSPLDTAIELLHQPLQ